MILTLAKLPDTPLSELSDEELMEWARGVWNAMNDARLAERHD
jgi:hypothetical protein